MTVVELLTMHDHRVSNHWHASIPSPFPIPTCLTHGVLRPPGHHQFPYPHLCLSDWLPQMLPFPLPIGYHSWSTLYTPPERYPPRLPWVLYPATTVSTTDSSGVPPLVTLIPFADIKYRSQHHPSGYHHLPAANVCGRQLHPCCIQHFTRYRCHPHHVWVLPHPVPVTCLRNPVWVPSTLLYIAANTTHESNPKISTAWTTAM